MDRHYRHFVTRRTSGFPVKESKIILRFRVQAVHRHTRWPPLMRLQARYGSGRFWNLFRAFQVQSGTRSSPVYVVVHLPATVILSASAECSERGA